MIAGARDKKLLYKEVAFDKEPGGGYLSNSAHFTRQASRLLENGVFMRMRVIVGLGILAALLVSSAVLAAPPIFKEKKYFGPIPLNSFSFNFGFLDGPDFDYLTEHLDTWSKLRCGERFGYDTFEEIPLSPYFQVAYERQLTPNHFFRAGTSISYITQSSVGLDCVSVPTDTTPVTVALDIERTLKVYLLSFDFGFTYCFVTPEVQRFSPYAGAGFSSVVPLTRLDAEATRDGGPFPGYAETYGEKVSENSLQAGMHLEFGMKYYISNRYAAGMEGRYQMSQSKFDIHGANFDLKYSGFTLTLNLIYLL